MVDKRVLSLIADLASEAQEYLEDARHCGEAQKRLNEIRLAKLSDPGSADPAEEARLCDVDRRLGMVQSHFWKKLQRITVLVADNMPGLWGNLPVMAYGCRKGLWPRPFDWDEVKRELVLVKCAARPATGNGPRKPGRPKTLQQLENVIERCDTEPGKYKNDQDIADAYNNRYRKAIAEKKIPRATKTKVANCRHRMKQRKQKNES